MATDTTAQTGEDRRQQVRDQLSAVIERAWWSQTRASDAVMAEITGPLLDELELLASQRDEARAVVREMCGHWERIGTTREEDELIPQWLERAGADEVTARPPGDAAHDPDTLCNCPPGGPEHGEATCEYRALADAADSALNPPDDDVAEVAIHIAAIERAAAYIRSLPCSCPPGAEDYEEDSCGRCKAIGQRCGKAEQR